FSRPFIVPSALHSFPTRRSSDLFGLFDLLGMRFCPRMPDIADARHYQLRGDDGHYPNLASRLTGRVNLSFIQEGWDELLRVAGSLKLGYVTASLLISKLQEYPRQNRITRLLKEYGRLAKTLHLLRYLKTEAYRRRSGRQRNKGERLHGLRSWLMFGDDGHIRRKQKEAQSCQACCLNLMTNVIVTWNTLYMQAALRQISEEGREITSEQRQRLSPTRFEHINR